MTEPTFLNPDEEGFQVLEGGSPVGTFPSSTHHQGIEPIKAKTVYSIPHHVGENVEVVAPFPVKVTTEVLTDAEFEAKFHFPRPTPEQEAATDRDIKNGHMRNGQGAFSVIEPIRVQIGVLESEDGELKLPVFRDVSPSFIAWYMSRVDTLEQKVTYLQEQYEKILKAFKHQGLDVNKFFPNPFQQ